MAHPLSSIRQQLMTVVPQSLVLARKTVSGGVPQGGMQPVKLSSPFTPIVIVPEKLDDPRFATLWAPETVENHGHSDFEQLPSALHELTDGQSRAALSQRPMLRGGFQC